MEREYRYDTLLDWAADILEKAGEPLTAWEIWQKSEEYNLHKETSDGGWEIWDNSGTHLLRKIKGKTPWHSMRVQLVANARGDAESARFVEIEGYPTKFYLKNKTISPQHEINPIIRKNTAEKAEWSEADLHPLLTYFAYKKLGGAGEGEGVRTKTIDHNQSTKKGFGEWLHPDLVGLHLPLNWDRNLKDLAKLSGNNLIKLYSFELKKSLNRGNYREAFFQAVSNSSWANEGYLVTAKIQDNQMLSSELKRLTSSFGIGIIHLDLDNFDSSSILYPATFKSNIDWETMNELHSKNPDFSKFIKAVRNSLDTTDMFDSKLDEVIKSPHEHIKKKKMK